MKKELNLTLLNNTQKKEVESLFMFYKFIYICNNCGSVYGADSQEKFKKCPICETKSLRKRRKK